MIAAILAGGPSLTEAVAHEVMKSGAFVVAVNDSWRLVPYADALFAADSAWWMANPNAAYFAGERLCCDADVLIAEYVPPRRIGSGSNSALQAAYWIAERKPDRIALFGVDLRDDALTHWHGPHPAPLANPDAGTFKRARGAWETFARIAPCDVVNCNPDSALTCFPKVSIAEALNV